MDVSLSYTTDAVPSREKLLRLEAAMLEQPQIEIPVRHIFAPGLYAREIVIPKGTLLTGKIHKTPHLNVISQGDISVLTEHGIQRITGPAVLVSSAGIKRAGYAHEETRWMTVHVTNETDLSKLEEELIAKDYAALETLKIDEDLLCLG
jgi:hypothetical protein